MRVTLPDGSEREVADGSTFLDLAKSIGPGLAKAVIAAKLDGELIDIQAPIPKAGKVQLLKADAPEAEDIIRHSCEHVLATAVIRLFKGAQVTMGPSDHSKDFYYDFDIGRAFSPEDITKIEAEMNKVIAEDVAFVRKEVSKAEAARLFAEQGQRFKPEILAWIPGDSVTLYQDADFIDLCRGPHVPSAGKIGAFRLLGAAGAYWRGDATKDPLQRIRGVAFKDQKALKAWDEKMELAKARDHRKLGKDLGLFAFSPLAPASPFFLPKGAVIYNQMVAYMRGIYHRYGYQEVITPQIYSIDVFKTSGHYANYRDNMYFAEPGHSEEKIAATPPAPLSNPDFSVKPMNCPGHCVLYSMGLHSFRDLPWRVADFGRLHRAEGEAVHGMMRVRTFCQDDAHIFCGEDQLGDEMSVFIDLVDEVYGDFGLTDVSVIVATRPEKRLGTDEVWDKAEQALMGALDKKGRKYTVAPGDGAFYGPKIELHVKDGLDRDWQLGTLQVDFMMPERFELEFVGHDGARHRPVMLHRAVFGSLERFYGVYLEHTGGAYPTWLAPIQAAILPITDRAMEHADVLAAGLEKAGVRVWIDRRNEKLGKKVAEARLQKFPYQLVVGDREVEQGGAALKARGGEDLGFHSLEALVAKIGGEAKVPGDQRPVRVAGAIGVATEEKKHA
jgi:threonyl-tRNA synthetase